MRVIREDDGATAYLGSIDDNEAMIRLDREGTTPAERVAAVTRLRGGNRAGGAGPGIQRVSELVIGPFDEDPRRVLLDE